MCLVEIPWSGHPEWSAQCAQLRAAFPAFFTDPVEGQGALAFLLLKYRVSWSVTLGRDFNLVVGGGLTAAEADLFDPAFLLDRPLLQALRHDGPMPPVLLIDEIDRADDEFEAFLLEVLADSAVTIPELGTQVAVHPPIAILTSNRTRDLHDALKRRCLYHWIDYPSTARATEIIRTREGKSQGLVT